MSSVATLSFSTDLRPPPQEQEKGTFSLPIFSNTSSEEKINPPLSKKHLITILSVSLITAGTAPLVYEHPYFYLINFYLLSSRKNI